MKPLSFNAVRTIVGGSLAAFLLCLANHRLELGLFGQFGKQMLVASSAVMVMVVMRFVPFVLEETQRRRDKANQDAVRRNRQ
jgi:energy-coupling factor transporter transmembrane protein EcfT